MSIARSSVEREQAVAKLEATSDDQLRVDLEYWAIAAADHERAYLELTDKRGVEADLHTEAQTWMRIITEQLQARRDRAREQRP